MVTFVQVSTDLQFNLSISDGLVDDELHRVLVMVGHLGAIDGYDLISRHQLTHICSATWGMGREAMSYCENCECCNICVLYDA